MQHVALRVAAAEPARERAQVRQQPNCRGVVAAVECDDRPAGRQAELLRGLAMTRGKRLPGSQCAQQTPGARAIAGADECEHRVHVAEAAVAVVDVRVPRAGELFPA